MSLKERVVTRHALERAAERYDLDLSPDDIREMQALIRANDPRAVFLGRRPGESHMVAIHRGGRWTCCVEEGGTIVTFLPPHEFAQYRLFLDGIDPQTGKPRPIEFGPSSALKGWQGSWRSRGEAAGAKAKPATQQAVVMPPPSPPAELPTPEEIERMANPKSENLEDLRAAADWIKATTESIRGLPDPDRIIDRLTAARKALRPRIWWAGYRWEAQRARVEMTTDPAALMSLAERLIDSLMYRLGYENLTEEDQGIRDLISRWKSREKFGEPPKVSA
jgi:hypothetical protein